jgi:hypothetical protein
MQFMSAPPLDVWLQISYFPPYARLLPLHTFLLLQFKKAKMPYMVLGILPVCVYDLKVASLDKYEQTCGSLLQHNLKALTSWSMGVVWELHLQQVTEILTHGSVWLFEPLNQKISPWTLDVFF